MIQSLNDSFLPISRLHQFADLALHQVSLQSTKVTDVQLPKQVFGFIHEGASQKFFAGFLVPFSIYILGTNRHFAGTSHGLAKFGNAEASFWLCVFSLG